MNILIMLLFASMAAGNPDDYRGSEPQSAQNHAREHHTEGHHPSDGNASDNQTPEQIGSAQRDASSGGQGYGPTWNPSAQHASDNPTPEALPHRFYEAFERFADSTITDRFFKQADIDPLINQLRDHPDFTVQQEGVSVQGRPIYLVKWGNGPKTVFMWSQMHGNEPTATMALMDVFNFLAAGEDEFDDERREWSQELTLLFMPMVNPDGAEVYQRRNALDVDLNRDALRLSSPESVLLKGVRDRYNALFGFNLHDQSVFYGTDTAQDPVAIAFLAPAYNVEKETNEVRERAKRLIGALHRDLRAYIPGQIARYDDTFEPRAFGDNMQRWGTSTILIESGGFREDTEKQYLRKLHFMMLLSSFTYIARDEYADVDLQEYLDLPMNRFNGVFGYVLRNGTVVPDAQVTAQSSTVGHRDRQSGSSGSPSRTGTPASDRAASEQGGTDRTPASNAATGPSSAAISFKLDLAFRAQEVLNQRAELDRYSWRLSDVGDVSTFGSYDEFNAEGFEIRNMKVYPEIFASLDVLLEQDWRRLLRQGFGYFRVYALEPDRVQREAQNLPFRVLLENELPPVFPGIGGDPALSLQHEDGRHYVFANGTLFPVQNAD